MIVLGLLILAFTSSYALDCQNDARFPWFPAGGITVMEPWDSYPMPEHNCCEVPEPSAVFDVQEKCSLCYDRTKSLPGYAADPNNCAKYYQCVRYGSTWSAFSMDCPNCTFWDQEKLTCVEVYSGPECGNSTFETGTWAFTTPIEDPIITCIDFNNGDVTPTNGLYVLNDGVIVDNYPGKCDGNTMCGYFNGSARLELPYFSNAYDHFKQFKVTFTYWKEAGNTNDQAFVSNDCYDMQGKEIGNSLYLASASAFLGAGLKDSYDNPVDSIGPAAEGQLITVRMEWDGGIFQLFINDVQVGTDAPFGGPIRNSHCPLVIGSFIDPREDTYFTGYMDSICFYKLL